MLASSNNVDESVVTNLGPALPAPEAVPVQPEASNPLLGHLLKIAESYRIEYALRQAIEIYFETADNFPNTPEAQQARQKLTEIAEHYERSGEFRQARSLYQRLLKLGEP
jgi:tetratricopeptide (TPR) repeat protein